MNHKTLKNLLPIFVEFKDSDDSELCNALEATGIRKEIAERICAFMPSAFSRVLFSHKFEIEFSETFAVEGSTKSFRYNEESIYKLSLEVAIEIYHSDPPMTNLINYVVERSAEYNAINKALNSGENLNGSTFSEIRYFGYKTIGKQRGLFQRLFS